LQKDAPQAGQNTSSPIGQDFNSLSQALQSGNLAQAQQAFTTTQTDLQNVGQGHHHHHHGGGGSSSSSQDSAISQDFTQLGQALQSGDLSSAQSLFSSLQNDLQQYRNNSGSLTSGSTSATNTQTATAAATLAATSSLSVLG
jgi:hypothetical protein